MSRVRPYNLTWTLGLHTVEHSRYLSDVERSAGVVGLHQDSLAHGYDVVSPAKSQLVAGPTPNSSGEHLHDGTKLGLCYGQTDGSSCNPGLQID